MAGNKKRFELKKQLISVAVAGLGAYFFGSVANLLWDNEIRCGGIGDIGGCDNTFIYIIGFYLGLFFMISLTHFGFIKRPSRYYYVTIGLLLFTSLILKELFLLALGYTAAGVLAGLAAAYFWRPKSA